MRNHAEILNGVQVAVAETLDIDVAEAQPSQRFFTDLGGESIEWLDLSFRLDKQFGVRIPGIGNYSGIETDAEGRFTINGIAALRAIMPGSLLDRVQNREPLPTAKELAEAITVEDIANMVQMAIHSKRAVPST